MICETEKGTAAELEVRRRLAVRMLSQGKTASEASELVGAGLLSVKRWKAAWKKGGLEAVAAKPHPGRKPRLTTAQKWNVERILLRGPRAAAFFSPPQQNLWVNSGSGSLPRLCNRASFATSGVRKP